MSISTAAIKELREKTLAGMMDCKKALTETNGNMEEAVDWLRAKGLASAAKKSGRAASEGLVGVVAKEGHAVVVEVNSETDFVAKNEKFQELVNNIAQIAFDTSSDVEKLKGAKYPKTGKTVEEEVTENVAVIGENLQLRRSAGLKAGVVVPYIHNAISPTLGKIGVLVAMETEGNKEKAAAFGKQVAMHIAAMRPESLNVEDLDPALIERERNVVAEQSRASGKPENVIEKMIEGRVRKFYAEVVLVEQTFVVDGKLSVKEALKAAEKDIGGATKITGYVRFELGEGVEKAEDNFADEVAKVAGIK